MKQEIILPKYVVDIFNLATIECIKNLSKDSTYFTCNNGKISDITMTPDNFRS